MIQTWSRESTETPIVEPKTQWFGSGFGQKGSTSNRGATPGAPNWAGEAAAGVAEGGAELDTAPEAGGAPLSQAASNALSEETSSSPARRVMVSPIRQSARQDQGLFLARIIAEIGASSRAGWGSTTRAALECLDRASGAGAAA